MYVLPRIPFPHVLFHLHPTDCTPQCQLTGRNKVRIAYMGKMLKESESLHAQGWQEGHVVNALVFS